MADQAVSGASNAVPLLIASTQLTGGELATLSLALLLATTAVSFQRALLLDPTLSVIGGLRVRWHRLSVGAVSAVGFAVIVAAVSLFTGISTDPIGLSAVTAAVGGSCLQDFLRYRALHGGRQRRAFVADAAWAAVSVVGVFFVGDSWVSVLLVWTAGAVVGALPLCFRQHEPRAERVLSQALSRGRFQVAESAGATLLTVVPMFVGSALGWDARVAAVRLVQSAFGPLNSIHSAVTLAVMTRSQELVARGRDEVERVHRTLQRTILLVAAIYVVACGAAMLVIPVESTDVANNVPLATIVVGLGILLTSASSPSIVLLRAFGFQDRVLYARLMIIGVAALFAALLMWAEPSMFDPATSMIGFSAVVGVAVWQLLRRRLLAPDRR